MRSPLEKAYAAGIADGFEISLKLTMGEPAAGAEPYSGPVPPELKEWAEAALARIDSARTAATL